MTSERCDECSATGRWGPCSELFMMLLALDHERRQPWAGHHTVNVACYLLQHPAQTQPRVLAGQWQVVDTFVTSGLEAVHDLTARAVRANKGSTPRHPLGHGSGLVPENTGPPATTIEDVAVDGTYPAAGYEVRMHRWAEATMLARGVSPRPPS